MKVCIVQSVLKGYRLPLFELLHRELEGRGIELKVLFSKANPIEQQREDNVSVCPSYAVEVPVRWFLGNRFVLQNIGKHTKDADLVIIEQANKYLASYRLLLASKLGRKLVAFWGHGRNRQADLRSFSERLKRFLAPEVDWWFAYTEGTRRYLEELGVASDRITAVQNATDTRLLKGQVAAVPESAVQALRQHLGIPPQAPVGLFVGSLHANKLLGMLVDSVPVIQREIPEFRLVVLGGGPERVLVQQAANWNPAVIYVGPKFGGDRAVYYRMASLFLNPGLVGLGILDAFAAGLPSVTTTYPYHSPEIEYLGDGYNGVITRSSADSFGYAVASLLKDCGRLAAMRVNASESAQKYTIEAMATQFCQGILACLGVGDASGTEDRHRGRLAGARIRGVWSGDIAVRRKVALLTNYIPPYRVATLLALQKRVSSLRIFSSLSKTEHVAWSPDWTGLDVEIQRTWSLRRRYRHPDGFAEYGELHIPYDTLWRLARFKPDVVISAELGARSAQAVIYRILFPDSRLVIHADLSEHTERAFGGLRYRLRYWMLKTADAVLVNGESGARYVQKLGVPAERIFRVPYASNTSGSMPADAVAREGEVRRLLYVGQLIERKGLIPFLDSLSHWLAGNPHRTIQFVVAGDGPLRDVIRHYPGPANLRVDAIGPVPYERVPQLYAATDLFILPTLADSWGLVVNEAMMAGVPVLGSDRSQAVEQMVVDGQNGWIFSPESPTHVRAALDRALRAPPNLLAMMKANARETALRVSPEHVADCMEAAIQRCFA